MLIYVCLIVCLHACLLGLVTDAAESTEVVPLLAWANFVVSESDLSKYLGKPRYSQVFIYCA